MIEIICSRSGLKFEAENRKKKIHPRISFYTSHNNLEIRYPAVEVIERGKLEGWDTIEKFEEEIEKALNPEPPPIPEHDFEGKWAARIAGSSGRYRFERVFLSRVHQERRFNYYNLAAEDGIYETCYESGKGNQTRRFWRVENGELTQISLQEVEKLFPEVQPVSTEGCLKVEKHFPANTIVQLEGQFYYVVQIDSVEYWEDEDGIAGTGYNHANTYIVFSETIYTSYLRPATPEEIEAYLIAIQVKADKKAAIERLKEIAQTVTVKNGAVSPESASYPQGKEFVLRPGYFQANEVLILEENRLWVLVYNGRDGDDWRSNNVAGSHVGCYLAVSPEQKTEIEELLLKANIE